MAIGNDIDALRDSLLKNKEETARLQGEKADALQDVAVYNKALAKAKKQKAEGKAGGADSPPLDIEAAKGHIRSSAQKAIDLSASIAQLEEAATKLEIELYAARQKRREERAAAAPSAPATPAPTVATAPAAPPVVPAPPAPTTQPAPIAPPVVKPACDKMTVLFMAANALKNMPLDLDDEARAIQEIIRKSAYRDSIDFATRWAARPLDILQAINETEPELIHFSGHGLENDEILLQGDDGQPKKVRLSAIVQVIMSAADTIRMVYFNMCFTEDEAKAVVKYVDAAIGMRTGIGDEAARVFAAQFYSALGFGKSLKTAFEQAKAALMLEGIQEEDTPMLFVKEGMNPAQMVLVKE
jgi:hypothetical protein